MAKFIFGSGLIGLIARKMLGQEYKIIPFGKSRFYTYNPATADNFIISNPNIDYCMRDMFNITEKYQYRRGYSHKGDLVAYSDDIMTQYLAKTCNFDIPPHASHYYKSQNQFEVYNIRCNELYAKLVEEYNDEIKKGLELSAVKSVTENTITFSNGKVLEYDEIINTIPMDVILNLMGIAHNLKANPVHIIHLMTNDINIEIFNQVFVVDPQLDFYKVTRISHDRYLFYFLNDHISHGIYLMPIIRGQFDIIDGTKIDNYILKGSIPKWQHPKIKNIGSYAQWDDCMDVGSCIYRIYLSKL